MKKETKRETIIRLGKIIIPFIIGIGVVLTIGFLLGEALRLKFWSLISGYFFPPLGKETIIPAGIIAGIDPLIMAVSIAFVDIIIALFLLWNYDLAKKIPIIGKFIIKVEKIGEKSSEKYAWIKPLRFVGIILFVMVPFQGSGGFMATIVGRLIGMKPLNTFLAISAGAIIGCTAVAYFAEAVKTVFFTNFLAGVLVVIILFIIGLMIFVYRKTNNKNNKKDEKE